MLLSDPTIPDGIKPRWQTAEQQRSARYQSMTATGPETGRECVRQPAPTPLKARPSLAPNVRPAWLAASGSALTWAALKEGTAWRCDTSTWTAGCEVNEEAGLNGESMVMDRCGQ